MSILKKDLAQLKTLAPRRKALILLCFLVLLAAGFLAGTYSFRGKLASILPPPATVKVASPSPTPKPIAFLKLIPATAVLKRGETIKVELVLERLAADALDVVLTYDPTYLKVKQLAREQDFSNYLRLKTEAGKILISASIDPNNPQLPPLPATIASFNLSGLKATESAIVDFDPDETIVAKDGENGLGLTIGGKYEIK